MAGPSWMSAEDWARRLEAYARQADMCRTRLSLGSSAPPGGPGRFRVPGFVCQTIALYANDRDMVMTEEQERVKLVSYKVTKLFGVRDVGFELDPQEPTLLTGSNGSGKSTILRTVDAICTGRWGALEKAPFKTITLGFSKGPALKVTKVKEGITVSSQGRDSWTYPTGFAGRTGASNVEIRRLRQLEAELRHGGPLNDRLTYEYERMRHRYADVDFGFIHDERPEWIDKIPGRLPVLFVTDQRLLIEPPSDPDSRRVGREQARTAVDESVEHVHGLMTGALSDYATESQRLDRDFPQRVVAAMRGGVQISDEELQKQLRDNDEEARLLQRVGLLPEDVEPQAFSDFSGEAEKPVIATHAADTAKKLSVLRPLRRSLAAFAEFLNQHYRTKEIVFDSGFGYRIVVGDQSIRPSQLSSGEQQILVLAFQILFKAEPRTLLLIDEPELSLHVTWQSSFIQDLTNMGAQRDLSFLLATHSPSLIGGREDLRRNIDAA
jgi:energy-coupling factor transporter ATP-binding protein EcfA2